MLKSRIIAPIAGIGAVVALAVALAACADSGDERPPAAEGPSSTVTVNAGPAPTPTPGSAALVPWPMPEQADLGPGSEATRLIRDTREKILAAASGLAEVRFLAVESVHNPTYARHTVTAEEAAASAANPNRNPAKQPFKEGDVIGSFGLPTTLYTAHILWADGREEQAKIGLRGGQVDGVWIDVIGQPHPRPGVTYVMFLRSQESGYLPAGPQFVLAGDRLEPFFDTEGGLGSEFVGATYGSLAAEFAGAVFENGP